MEKTLLALVTLAAMAGPAWATMPLLGEKPPMRTDEACWAWADQQAKDEEIAYMWGIRPHRGHLDDRRLLGRVLDKDAVVAAPEAERGVASGLLDVARRFCLDRSAVSTNFGSTTRTGSGSGRSIM